MASASSKFDKSELINFKAPRGTLKDLAQYVAQADGSLASLLRKIVREWLESQEKK